jgi:aconitate hydratase
LTGVYDAVPAVARAYKAAGVASIVVGDHNYGEGSSGSMLLWNLVPWVKPYWLNHLLVSTRQTLKTRLLGLIFDNESDYDKIQ